MPKKHQNDPRSAPKRPQDDQKSDPERQDDKRTEPRRFQDRLGSAPRGPTPVCPHPWGSIWKAKTAPKSIPKRSKIEAKNEESKKSIQDDLGSVLRRSWAVLGAILGPWKRPKHYACRCFVKIHFFDVKTIQRRSWDQLWPIKAPK